MPVTISFATSSGEMSGLTELTRRFLQWDLHEFEKASGLSLDLEEYLSNTLDHIDDYLPPDGRLMMARDENDALVGMVMMRRLTAGEGEIKRVFVRPDVRGCGIGKRLVEAIVEEARRIGYQRLFLDTGTYMTAAHALYRSMGFCDTDAYPGSENDATVQEFLIFMKLEL